MGLHKEKPEFDFLFAGGGLAALSLALRLVAKPVFADKKIIIVEPVEKTGNDRTWCFWEKENGFFEALVEKNWELAGFHTDAFSKELNLKPYSYKMIRSARFYENAIAILKANSNVEFLKERIQNLELKSGIVHAQTESGRKISAELAFNSLVPPTSKKAGHHYFLQHFRGWFIRSHKPAFNPESATLMDFRIEQAGDCRFVYVLPFSENTALVEYTIFSENLLESEQYDDALRNYLHSLLPDGYEILEAESGIIPMYSEAFPKSESAKIINIGTAGGMTKASTGYTFTRIQKHSDKIIEALVKGEIPKQGPLSGSARHAWFDRVLLRVLAEKRMSGKDIFENLFKKNPAERVLRFLDDEASLLEEFKIMSSVPSDKFMIPGIREFLRKDS
jgi:lycopene beta-cyclase